jgi:hypothetical protein
MKILYFMGAYVFYFLGDICSKFPFELFFVLYQKFMNISYNLDKKNNFKIWKLP